MYRRLRAGEFGNTNASWTEYTTWWLAAVNHPVWSKQKLWGVRHTKVANWPGTRLNVPTEQVRDTIWAGKFGNDFNVSPMVPGGIRWEGDVSRRHDGPGLLCSGNARPVSGSWRTHMQRPRLWEGSAADVLLKWILNENSYDDLMAVLDAFPDHVVELTALDNCFGTVPGRNAVVWEVRKY